MIKHFFLLTYILLLLWLTVFSRPEPPDYRPPAQRLYNLVPFKNITHFLNAYPIHGRKVRRGIIANIGGNLLLFTPLALFFRMYVPSRKRKPWIIVIAALLPPLLLEILQWMMKRGVWDIDDIILNATGFLIGIFLAFLSQKLMIAFKAKSPG